MNIRSNAGQAQFMQFHIQRVFPKWFNVLAVLLFLVGSGFSMYWLIRSIAFLSQAIGVA